MEIPAVIFVLALWAIAIWGTESLLKGGVIVATFILLGLFVVWVVTTFGFPGLIVLLLIFWLITRNR